MVRNDGKGRVVRVLFWKAACVFLAFLSFDCVLYATIDVMPVGEQTLVTASNSISVAQDSTLFKTGTATLLITQPHDVNSAYGTIAGAIEIQAGGIAISDSHALGSGGDISANNIVTMSSGTSLIAYQASDQPGDAAIYALPQKIILSGDATLDTGINSQGGITTENAVTYGGNILTVIGQGALTPSVAMGNDDTGTLTLSDMVVLNLNDPTYVPSQINLTGGSFINAVETMTLDANIYLGTPV